MIRLPIKTLFAFLNLKNGFMIMTKKASFQLIPVRHLDLEKRITKIFCWYQLHTHGGTTNENLINLRNILRQSLKSTPPVPDFAKKLIPFLYIFFRTRWTHKVMNLINRYMCIFQIGALKIFPRSRLFSTPKL